MTRRREQADAEAMASGVVQDDLIVGRPAMSPLFRGARDHGRDKVGRPPVSVDGGLLCHARGGRKTDEREPGASQSRLRSGPERATHAQRMASGRRRLNGLSGRDAYGVSLSARVESARPALSLCTRLFTVSTSAAQACLRLSAGEIVLSNG